MSRTEHSIPVKYQGHEEFASFQSLWLDVISYIAPISAFVLLYHVANSCPFILFPKLSSVLLLPDLFLLFNSSVKLFSPAVFFFVWDICSEEAGKTESKLYQYPCWNSWEMNAECWLSCYYCWIFKWFCRDR